LALDVGGIKSYMIDLAQGGLILLGECISLEINYRLKWCMQVDVLPSVNDDSPIWLAESGVVLLMT